MWFGNNFERPLLVRHRKMDRDRGVPENARIRVRIAILRGGVGLIERKSAATSNFVGAAK
jgi:hypothetical protein